MGINKKATLAPQQEQGETVIPAWETKLREKYCFSNNPGRWSNRQSADEVIAFIKEELNEPIIQYEKQLAVMWRNKLVLLIKQGHGGGNWRRLLEILLAETEKEIKK
jgi:hypothetical protein